MLTLLLTDVVDSTQLNDELGDGAMAALWKAHDRAARELMVVWGGQEIARSDGFLVLFRNPRDGVAFAVAYHQALRTISARLKARVGLHVGEVSLRENTDTDKVRGAPAFEVDGVALPVVARVMSAALGGQTLLTASAVQALGGAGAGLTIKSHGHWRLKGLTEPLELLQVDEADASFEPPSDSAKAYRVVRTTDAWVPARKIPNNLPAERDAFIGRAEALQTLATLLEGPTRLVTVLGIGGIGKTRMVLRHATTWLGDYPGGAWFCDLSTARGLDGIVYAVAQALDVPLGKSDPVQQIASAIAARGACLVLLDTFEQVARHAEATIGVWLERAPQAKFIVTSREVLGIAGEQALVLTPMTEDEGCRLFAGRAAATSSNPTSSLSDKAAISRLVTLLDGLPLAIELAAARSRVLSPRMLLDRMNERFTVLAMRGGRLDRQVTLRATLDWSWELLSTPEKSALAQLSVFEGGFSLEAAEAVVVTPDSHSTPPMDLVQSLVDKSFVRRTADDRFDLLQSVQEYAAQHLRAENRFEGSGPSTSLNTELRHGIYYGGLSEHEVTARASVELDNLASACRRASQRGDCTTAFRTLALGWAVLELRGPFRLGVELASLVLSMPGLPISIVASVQIIKGRASKALGRISEARASFETALTAARDTSDRRCEGEALSKLGSLKANLGRSDEAALDLKAGLTLARTIGDKTLECELLNGLGTLHDYMGRMDAALNDYEQALAVARQIDNRRWEGGVLGNLGNVYYSQGEIAKARAAYEAGLVVARELGNRQWEGDTLCNLGLLRHVQGESEEARSMLGNSLQVAREIGHARLEAIVLCNLGLVEGATERSTAGQHFTAALAIAEVLGDQRLQGQTLGYLGLLLTRQGHPREGRRQLDRGKDVLLSVKDELSLALLQCASAEAHLLNGDRSQALTDLEVAREIAERLGGDAVVFDLRLALTRAEEQLLKSHASVTRC